MNANEMIDAIEEIFPDAHCELNHETPFQLLIAVVLSAQTTDASVNKVTPALFERWPDSSTLAKADLREVEQTLKTLGLFRSKAKNIIALSQDLEEKFDGQVPMTFKDLQSLAGVGRKTANVVRSVAFDIPSLAVDTHVNRVSKRLGLAKPEDSVEKVEEKLRRKIDRNRWNKAHHDLIFFGRYFCTARNPKCDECPFVPSCKKKKLDLYTKKQKEMEKAKILTQDKPSLK
ncbi:endonuclease III [Ileibacterium valens]|uniref:Endonuclease III n=1 Tax=Ileibacterium valens TaxID=1862668 RepID=A0A1U7NF31_9FIRM|nr:endonuclease III [Ileibacterium valens]OLU38539.1 endonuclease III [Ileibacterium valens]OLU39132.1 endonuclease III [Erysipelotrichaceae bacterium NYU-BL-E8]OLU39495.1 endonuclease III [Erysipelotrichaceae bacterium NYU-BL-F16]